MDTKKYFDDPQTIVSSTDIDSLAKEVESYEYMGAYIQEKERFVPRIDFSSASNFAFFGSAEQYYNDAVKRIYQTYPYDGSLYERTAWHLSSSYLDNYIFENEYPRTNGYVIFGTDRGDETTQNDGYPSHPSPEYISFRGGPHPSTRAKGKKVTDTSGDYRSGYSNVYDQSKDRGSNLKIDGNTGNTVEFWMKKAETVTDRKEVIFDTYTVNADQKTDGYGQISIEIGHEPIEFRVTYISGNYGFQTASLPHKSSTWGLSNYIDNKWHHYAFTFANSGSNLQAKLYVDGEPNSTITGSEDNLLSARATSTIDYVSGGMYATIGALATSPSGNTTPQKGWASLCSASLDEFRFWKTKRSSQQIGRHWFTQVGGGSNTDDANTNLGVYYKFNEGVTGDSSIDSTALDYSGRINNGTWTGYTSNSRSTGSAIVLSNLVTASYEFKDPILYNTHPGVNGYLTSSLNKGKYHDIANNAAIYNSLPAWIIDEDGENGEILKKLTQIMASYFDTLQLQIQELPTLQNIVYPSGSYEKPYHFIKDALESKGFITSEIFADADILAQFLNQSNKELFNKKLYHIKNQIYQNIYNSLANIYKTKGTEKAFRNLIRCFGIDHEILKLNLYADQSDYTFEDNFSSVTINKNCVDFNSPGRSDGTVYQFTSSANTNSISFISGSKLDLLDTGLGNRPAIPFTTEAEVIFPKYNTPRDQGHFTHTNLSASLFGMHTAKQTKYIEPNSVTGETEAFGVAVYNDLAWHSNDVANFQVYACRKTLSEDPYSSAGYTNKDAYFVLTSSQWGALELTSSVFKDIYDNQKWNFAVRVKPEKHPLASYVSGTLIHVDEKMELPGSPLAYVIEFYGVNNDLNIVNNEFLVTGTLSQLEGENFLSSSKRVYAGAHRTNFTGSSLASTDVKFSSLRCWLDYLDNETIQAHARDPKNVGRLNPYKPAYMFEVIPIDGENTTVTQPYVPQMETLVLDWTFGGVTSSGPSNSDAYYAGTAKNARFPVTDMSSGSTNITSSYGAISAIASMQHTGRGDFFSPLNKSVISKEYIYSAKQNIPENVNSSDLVQILNTDDVVFTKHIRPASNFFAIEKSMYQTISEEILRFFATIKDFNNLIGEPANRYRQDYKTLGKLRQLFFDRKIEDTDEIVSPDLEKYIDYYKWIDQSISKMIQQIIPASARFSEDIRNVIESHILERNKYWSKLPIVEKKNKHTKEVLEGGVGDITTAEDTNAMASNPTAYPPNNIISNKIGNPSIETIAQRGPTQMTTRLPRGGDDWNINDSNTNTLAWPITPRTEPAVTTGDDDRNNDRQKILDAIINTKLRISRAPYSLFADAAKPIYGGVNTTANKKPTLFRTLINNVSGSENVGLEITNEKITKPQIFRELKELYFKDSKERELIKTSRAQNRGAEDDGSYFGDSYTKFSAPFTAVSSSVNTGYNARIISSFTGGIDFANLHQDIYAPHYEVPMQGTFTEKWVGGLPYRHVFSQLQSHGFTADNVSNRVEGWAIDFREDSSSKFIVFRSPISASINNPRAMFWSGPKRPVNIKNIRMTTGSGGFQDPTGSTKSGNYRFDYNIVSTSGRKINNRYFVKNEGININWADHQKPDSEYLPIQGVPDFTSVNRFVTGSNKFIFVNKFGAPGGPETMSEAFLDLESGEYSVYNGINYRNLAVRLPLREYLTNHTNQFGYWSDTQYSASWQTAIADGIKAVGSYAGTQTNVKSAGYVGTSTSGQPMPSYHNVNRNSLKRIELQDASSHNTITGAVHDNYWVQHPTPRTDIQYSWVSSSLISGYTGSALYGYERQGTNSIRRYGPDASTDLVFLSASLTGAAVFGGHVPVDFVGLNTLIYDPLSASLNLLSSSNGVYKNTNIASIASPNDFNSLILHRQGPYGWPSWKQIRLSQHPIIREEQKNNMTSFVVDSLSGQVDRLYHFTESIATSRFKPMVHVFKEGAIQHTYGNNLTSFANVEMQNKLKFKPYGGNQVYDNIKNLYLEDVVSLKPSLISLYYREMIYPREINVYLAKARMRTNYIVDFWRESRSDRTKNSATNSQGQTILKQSIWPLDAREDFATATARGKASSAGNDAAGELQNNYTTYIGDTDSSGLPVKVIPAACYARPISASAAEGELLYGDTLWEGGDPFYDSYDAYSNEIRRVGQNYSIASEFRISEHMEYYLDEKNGDFFADREGFLTCTGSNHADSTEEGFFKTYSHSDFLKYFSLVYEDHKGVIDPSRISLTCNAIMKLLPYKGFYPADRTLQLATLFSQSYGSTDFGSDSYSDNSKRRVALTPFFAPGILYNSIKSGIAVDYPIYTKQPGSTSAGATVDGTTVYTEGTGSTSANEDIYRLSASFDFRLPFDSLVRPETYIGNGSYIYEAEPDPRARVSGSSTTNAATSSIKLDLVKSDTYKLAMHNFLATSIDLFLKNGEVSTLITSKNEDIYIVDRNVNTYKMRIYLADHQDVSTNAGRTFSMYNRQSAFGPTVNAPDNRGGYAPFTPPYYYNDIRSGHAYVEYSFTPWKHTVAEKYGTEGTDEYTLDEIVSNSTITEFRSADNSQFSGSSSGDNYVQDINMMNLTASINIFQKDAHLVVQPKFETPMLNFTNVTKTSPASGDASTKGMWHQKGVYETDNTKGVFFGALDVADSESLADLITLDKGLKKLGALPDDKEKTIREAVVAIPVIKKFNKRTGKIQTKFINVHKNIVKRAVADILEGKTSEESLATDSVYNMVKSMRRYVIPPQFDFLTHLKKFGSKRFRPFAMYLFEFEHELTQEELANIWQNIRPEIAQTHKKEKAIICHQLERGELLTATELKNPDLHWMVFKVKQKAKWNYFDKVIYLAGTLPPRPDAAPAPASVQMGNPTEAKLVDSYGSLNPFQAVGHGQGGVQISSDVLSGQPSKAAGSGAGLTTHATAVSSHANIKHGLLSSGILTTIGDVVEYARLESDVASGYGLEYNYNWPYDFCSLVELIKVDVEAQLGGKGLVQIHPAETDMSTIGSGEESVVVTGEGAALLSSLSPDVQEEAHSATNIPNVRTGPVPTGILATAQHVGKKLALVDSDSPSGEETKSDTGEKTGSTKKLGLID